MKQGGRGKAFEALVIYSFNSSPESYALRLRDSIKGAFCMGCKNYINLSNKMRQQPFDYVVIHKSRPFAIEAKSVHGVSFPFRNIKDHQINELSKFEEHGSAHVLLEFIPGSQRPRKYFLIPILVFKEIVAFYQTEGNERESVPMKLLEEYSSKNKIWEVSSSKNDKKKPVLLFSPVLDGVISAKWSN